MVVSPSEYASHFAITENISGIHSYFLCSSGFKAKPGSNEYPKLWKTVHYLCFTIMLGHVTLFVLCVCTVTCFDGVCCYDN
jgi:hypothetical protein